LGSHGLVFPKEMDDIIEIFKKTEWTMLDEAKEAGRRGDRDGELHCRGVAEGLAVAHRGLQALRATETVERHLRVVRPTLPLEWTSDEAEVLGVRSSVSSGARPDTTPPADGTGAP
jgi:hypothetical protein